MGSRGYRFRERWVVPAAPDRVFGVLSDVDSYPLWWRAVRSVRRTAADRAEVACRSVLPYTLRFEARELENDRAAGRLRIGMRGDLNGVAGWTLTAHPVGTALVYDQEVTVGSLFLRGLGVIARPALTANHAVMMSRGRRGLRRWLTARPG